MDPGMEKGVRASFPKTNARKVGCHWLGVASLTRLFEGVELPVGNFRTQREANCVGRGSPKGGWAVLGASPGSPGGRRDGRQAGYCQVPRYLTGRRPGSRRGGGSAAFCSHSREFGRFREASLTLISPSPGSRRNRAPRTPPWTESTLGPAHDSPPQPTRA